MPSLEFDTLPLKRRAICPCGDTVLNESIQVGVRYHVTPIVGGADYLCGNCGKIYRGIPVVMANSILNPDAPFCPLPWGLFSEVPQNLIAED